MGTKRSPNTHEFFALRLFSLMINNILDLTEPFAGDYYLEKDIQSNDAKRNLWHFLSKILNIKQKGLKLYSYDNEVISLSGIYYGSASFVFELNPRSFLRSRDTGLIRGSCVRKDEIKMTITSSSADFENWDMLRIVFELTEEQLAFYQLEENPKFCF